MIDVVTFFPEIPIYRSCPNGSDMHLNFDSRALPGHGLSESHLQVNNG